ncbi:Glutamate Receptor Ionotropic, Nmda 2A [Manis pentadactyla]|nr:Glutamate Receptor Ionotropic, Nmda 2A [Manis pentadactyla]
MKPPPLFHQILSPSTERLWLALIFFSDKSEYCQARNKKKRVTDSFISWDLEGLTQLRWSWRNSKQINTYMPGYV